METSMKPRLINCLMLVGLVAIGAVPSFGQYTNDGDNTFFAPASRGVVLPKIDGVYVVNRTPFIANGYVISDDIMVREERITGAAVHRYSRKERYCCRGLRLEVSPGGFTGGRSSTFLGLLTELVRGPSRPDGPRNVHMFFSEPIDLPADGSTVRISLTARGRTGEESRELASFSVRLAPRTIVIPVHVHVFANRSGELRYSWVNENLVRSWFVGRWLNIISAGSARDHITGNLNTEVFQGTMLDFGYQSAGEIWKEAGIQFNVVSYEVIRQNANLDGILFNDDDARRGYCSTETRLSRTFRDDFTIPGRRFTTPGLHLIVGGKITLPDYRSGPNPAIACGRNCYDTAFAPIRFIAINGDALPRRTSGVVSPVDYQGIPNEVPREIGRFLGLGNTDTPFCVTELGPFSDMNLMDKNKPRGWQLSNAQKVQARRVACELMREWHLPARPCEE